MQNTQYDYIDLAKNNGANSNEYELLINGYGLDYSYAQVLKRLCNLEGIECEVVTGNVGFVGEAHGIWEAVKIDGNWSYVDIY